MLVLVIGVIAFSLLAIIDKEGGQTMIESAKQLKINASEIGMGGKGICLYRQT